MTRSKIIGEGVGTLAGDTTTLTLEDTSSHSANTGPAISFKSKDSGGTTREVAKVIGESHSGTNEGNLALQTRNGGTLETKWKVFKNGSLLPSSTDYGIYLGATAAGDANLLNDYEEGSFSPTFSQSGATVSMSSIVGFYTKIGRVVHASGRIQSSSVSGGSGVISIAGLPFTSNSGSAAHSATIGVTFSGWSSTNGPSVGFIQSGADKIELYRFDSSDARDQRDTPVTSFGDGSVGAIFNVVYTT